MPDVRELTVSLSLRDNNFAGNMKSISQQIKQAESNFKAAGGAVNGYGSKQEQARAKVTMLEQKLKLQNTAVQECEKNLKRSQTTYQTATEKQKSLAEALSKAKTEYGENSEEAKKLEGQLKSAEKAVQKAQDKVSAAATALNNAKIDVAQTTRELEQANRELVISQSRWTTFSDKMSKVSEVTGVIGERLTDVGQKMTAKITAPLIAMGAAAVKTFTSYDDSLKEVQATMGLVSGQSEEADRQIQLLDETAQAMGISTRYSASDAASALNYLALAGYDADKACAALPTVLRLAQAGGLDLAYASDLATDAMAAMGLETKELDGFVDKMAVSAQKSNTSVSQLGEAILTVGGTAKSLAGGTAELNTALGTLANVGIKGSEGGTHLRNIILALTAPQDGKAKELKELGISATDAYGQMRPLNEIMQDFNTKLSGLTDAQKTEALSKIFNKTDLAAVQGLLSGCGAEWDSLMGAIQNSEGAAETMATTMESGIGGALRSLKSATEGLAISFGGELAPMVKSAAERVTDMTRKFASLSTAEKQNVIKTAAVAAAAGPVLLIAGKISTAISGITGAMSKVGTFLAANGGILGTFSKLGTVISSIGASAAAIPVALAATAVIGVKLLNDFAKTWEGPATASDKLMNLSAKVSEAALGKISTDISTAVGNADANVNAAVPDGKKSGITTAIENAINGSKKDITVKVADTAETVTSPIKDAISSAAQQPVEINANVANASAIHGQIEEAVKGGGGHHFDVAANLTNAEEIGTQVDDAVGGPRVLSVTVLGKDAIKTEIEGGISAADKTVTLAADASGVTSGVDNGIKEAKRLVIPKLDSSEIKSGIEKGIEAADKAVKITADTSDLFSELNKTWGEASADGKITQSEFKTISTWVSDNVGKDADAAVEAAKGYWKKVYEAATGAGASEEDATAAADKATNAFPLKETAEKLQSLSSDLDSLLRTIYSQGESATAEELQNVKALMGEIETLQGKLGILKTEAGEYAENAVTAVKMGYGTEKQMGTATAYIEQTYEARKKDVLAQMDQVDAERARAVSLAHDVEMTGDVATAQQMATEAVKNYEQEMSRLNQELEDLDLAKARELDELIHGVGKTVTSESGEHQTDADVDAAIKQVEAAITIMEKWRGYQELVDTFDPEYLAEAKQNLQQGLDGLAEVIPQMDQVFDHLYNPTVENRPTNTGEVDWANTTVAQIEAAYQEAMGVLADFMTTSVADTEANPIFQFLDSVLSEDAMQSYDWSTASGAMATVMKAKLLSEGGLEAMDSDDYKSIGASLTESVGSGIEEGAGEAAGAAAGAAATINDSFQLDDTTSDGANMMQGAANGIRNNMGTAVAAASTAAGAISQAFKSRLGIASPSKVFAGFGKYTMQGFEKGFQAETKTAERVMRNAAGYLANGFAGTTINKNTTSTSYDNSNTLTVQNMYMSNGVDVQALMDQMTRSSRRTQRGYGM